MIIEQIPFDYIKAKFGVKPTRENLERLAKDPSNVEAPMLFEMLDMLNQRGLKDTPSHYLNT